MYGISMLTSCAGKVLGAGVGDSGLGMGVEYPVGAGSSAIPGSVVIGGAAGTFSGFFPPNWNFELPGNLLM